MTMLGVALTSPSPAAAEEPTPPRSIAAEGPCLGKGDLPSVVRRHSDDRARPPGARVAVTELPRGARIDFFVGERSLGSRTIDAEAVECREMVEAVGLAIAVLLDSALDPALPAQSSAAPAPDVASPPTPTPVEPAMSPPPRPPPSPRPRSTPKERPSPQARVAASLEIGGGAGLTPQPSATGALMVDVGLGAPLESGARPELSGRLGLMVAFPSTSELGDAPLVSSVVAPRLDLCFGVLGASLRGRACAVGIAGALVTDAAGDYVRVALGGRVDGRWMLTPRVGLQASADALANVAPSYVGHALADGSYAALEELGPVALSFQGGLVVELL